MLALSGPNRLGVGEACELSQVGGPVIQFSCLSWLFRCPPDRFWQAAAALFWCGFHLGIGLGWVWMGVEREVRGGAGAGKAGYPEPRSVIGGPLSTLAFNGFWFGSRPPVGLPPLRSAEGCPRAVLGVWWSTGALSLFWVCI